MTRYNLTVKSCLLITTLCLAACGGSSGNGSNGDDSAYPGEAQDFAVSFENTGENCRNFLIISPITEENARKFVPPEFELSLPPVGFVELADCPSGSIDGVETGPYRIAEAAVFITPPDGESFPPITAANSAIYLLWQLDTNHQLSAKKRNAGFFGEVVEDIELSLTESSTVPGALNGYANVPFDVSPYQLEAELLPEGPQGPPLPNSLWHLGPNGVINTFNDIYATDQILAGIGTITVAEGSVLHELFGSTSVTGVAASGVGSFVNTTQLRPDIEATPAPMAP
ncbi:hypothetical protein I6N98_12945 [Spongiibacter nanhainus]|uniref:Spondin N n=1 Tax=Spongiibacter nanhainus TaxID=2794344 RepID=A0A7T4UP43_9GAMM|nr:hypothetical protein [Spongiibacter nanhainus]QQD17268.1 hypothetical protein I6N98_12945 [Spongiibacter nanhainus]